MSGFENFVTNVTGGDLLGKIIVAIVLVCLIGLVSHMLVKWLRHIMQRDDTSIPQSSIFINIVRGIVWGLGGCFVLDTCFNVNMSALIAALGVGGIALSLGFQDTLSNLIGGVQVSITGLVEPGDYIEVGGRRGVVHDVTWRHTSLETLSGERVVVPNSVINKSSLTHLPPLTKVVVPLIVTTGGADLDAVAAKIVKTAGQAAQKVGGGMSQEPQVLFTEAMECGYRASLIVWVEDGDKHSLVKDAVVRAVAPYTMA